MKTLKELSDELVSFGRQYPSPLGSSYYLGDDGRPWKDRPRETWITSRMVHVYSIASMLGYDGAGELAAKGLSGLKNELYDSKNGGWFAGLCPDGTILPSKQCYAHAFVILAASSGVLAKIEGADELLNLATSTYDKYFWDEKEGLAVDTWSTDFTVLDSYRGLNANMHSVEAFLAVFDCKGDVTYRDRAGRIIERVLKWAKKNNYRIPEHFTSEWEPELELNSDRPDDPFKPYGATPGHGIEWARLITQWAASTYGLGSAEAQSYISEAEKLYERARLDGWFADGNPGLVYTTDWDGRPVVRDRMHWTLAEAINTSSVLFRATGDKKYKDHFKEYLAYLDEYVVDKKNGSWFHQLDENNKLKETVWPGKSDLYHAFQATLIPDYPINLSIARAVFEANH